MNTWTFKPLVDGSALTDVNGNEVQIDIEVPIETKDIEVATYVNGEQLKDKYLLPNNVYDILKWVGLLFLPTMAWVYTMLAGAWNLPYAEQVPFTLNVLGTMIAILIGASSLNNITKGDK